MLSLLFQLQGWKALVGLIVDVETGKDYQFPRPYERSDQLILDVQYKKNSSAICVSNSWKNKGTKEKAECYNFKEEKFILIN